MGQIIRKGKIQNPRPKNRTKNDLVKADKGSTLFPSILDVFIFNIHFPSVEEKIDISNDSVIIQEMQIDKVINTKTPISG